MSTESKMGTPANGYTKARPAARQPQRLTTVRAAVTEFGDAWRLFGPAGFWNQPCETWTQADADGHTMSLMERGIIGRVREE